MRIDDATRSLQTQEAQKTDKVGADQSAAGSKSSYGVDSDAASISPLAASALDPAADASSIKNSEARLETLRVQIERGEYKVSSGDLAAHIIDQHTIG